MIIWQGLRANLGRTFNDITEELYESCETKSLEFKAISDLEQCSPLHCCIQQTSILSSSLTCELVILTTTVFLERLRTQSGSQNCLCEYLHVCACVSYDSCIAGPALWAGILPRSDSGTKKVRAHRMEHPL